MVVAPHIEKAGAGDPHDVNRPTLSAMALADLKAREIDIVTIGQYLRPTPQHLPIQRYATPDEFREYARLGKEMGLRHVESGPLVRSSYHAWDQLKATTAASPAS